MNELKPEDVYKWLDEIANNENLKQCSGIPSTTEAALALLREKDAIIAKHEEYIDTLNDDKACLVEQIEEKDAEIERLTAERDRAQAICVEMGKLNQAEIAIARTEVITELLERAKSQAREMGDLKPFVLTEDLEEIAKTLKGGKL